MKQLINKIMKSRSRGAYLPVILLSATLFLAFATALATIAMANVKRAVHHERMISAMDVAEAGINYYMWHLSHDNADYCDGNACPETAPFGPYHHDYKDQSGKIIGSYDLYITPPAAGEAVTQIKSIGKLINSRSERIVIADVGMPSFARYSFLSATECWFGEDEVTNGPVHSNVGVHFDGTASGVVSASSKTYKPSASFGGDGQYHNGVWGNGGPTGFWVYPVPAIDFNKVSVDFTNLNTKAHSGGISLGDSNALGYYLKLNSNNVIDVYKVTRERTTGINTTFLQSYPEPGNGIIYVADNVWIDGTYNSKLTIVAEITKNNQDAVIKIKNNLLYGAKDGSSNIGLVSESNIEVPQYAPSNLEINAAMLSQKGHVWFPYANGYIKNTISVYGSISTNQYWTWSWVDGNNQTTSGYQNTSQTYDPYLTLAPPPEFPTTGSYAILNWREE